MPRKLMDYVLLEGPEVVYRLAEAIIKGGYNQ